MDASGCLHFIGRSKNIIVRSGENIAPCEIEEELLKLDGIKNAVVTGVPDEHRGEEICACILSDKNDPETVRSRLADRLSPYKMPKYFVFFDRFPLLPNGKTDIHALSRIAIDRLGIEDGADSEG